MGRESRWWAGRWILRGNGLAHRTSLGHGRITFSHEVLLVRIFPFNVLADPMYWGSSMSFAGVALWFGKPAGLILTLVVIVAYTIALRFEGPFTAQIYASAAKKESNSKKEAEIAQLQAVDGPAHRTRASAPASPAKRNTRSRKSTAGK